MLGSFVKFNSERYSQWTQIPTSSVFLVKSQYGKSPVFQSYMKSMNACRYAIPSYVDTRFYSLYKLFHAINKLFDIINKFAQDELLPESYKSFIKITDFFLTTFEFVKEKFEKSCRTVSW